MADACLPDVVPAKVLATPGKDSAELSAVVVVSGSAAASDPSSIAWCHENSVVEPPIVVQIWSNSGTPDSPPPSCPSTPVEPRLLGEEISLLEQHRRRSTSQHSDSGIESQLASPTVTDVKLRHQQSFVLELSTTHLTVPGRFRAPLTIASGTNPPSALPENEDDPVQTPTAADDDSDRSESENSEPAPPTNAASSNSFAFLPHKRHHRNLLPVDLDGWRKRSDNFTKIRSLPTEAGRKASTNTADDGAAIGGSWSDSSCTPLANYRSKSDARQPQLSPKICIELDDRHRKGNSGRSLAEQSTVSESRRSVGSYSSESEGSAADHDVDLGSYYSSRQASVCSDRSESASIEQSLSDRNAVHLFGNKRQDEPSQMSRFNLLSVPSRNNFWPTPSDQRRTSRSALHSQLGSMSSLMNSHFSLSNSYLGLAMSGSGGSCGMDDIVLVNSSVYDSERYGEGYMLADEAQFYEREQAAARAAQLSLTQRLAFPQLMDADAELGYVRSKAYSRQNELPREESSLNFFAKIITFLVLVFVIVLVVGVLIKISHTPK